MLAKKAIVCCGSISMGLGEFASAAGAIDLLYDSEVENPLDPSYIMDEHIADILSGIASTHQSKNFGGMRPMGFHYRILHLLAEFHAAQCLDDRDRIYAILGLSDDTFSKDYVNPPYKRPKKDKCELEITYENGVGALYINLATGLLQGIRYFEHEEILHCAGAFRPHSNQPTDIPSWVPDWRAERRCMPILGGNWYTVGPWSENGGWKLSDDKRNLHLTGWKIGTVSEIGFKYTGEPRFEDIKEAIQHWRLFYDTRRKVKKRKKKGPKGSTWPSVKNYPWVDEFFDAVTMTRLHWDSSYVYPPDEFYSLLFNDVIIAPRPAGFPPPLSRGANSGTDDQGNMRSHVRRLKALMQGRVFCANEHNVPMNCPDDVEIGDEVVVFAEVNTPFVVRPLNPRPSRGRRERRYRLVGDCYVQGVMEGELLKGGEMPGESSQYTLV